MQALGKELKRLRGLKNWTQAYAAREIGIQQSYLSKLENGQFLPSNEVLEKLTLCYEVSFKNFVPVTPHVMPAICLFHLIAIITLIFSVLLGLSAQFEIFYPETYFTYQTQSTHFWAVNVTPYYRGEQFIEGDVIYSIIGERRVSQYENRLLNALALLLMCTSCALIAFKKFYKAKV